MTGFSSVLKFALPVGLAIAERAAWLLFLKNYLPDLSPIEMSLSKYNQLLREEKART
ncbi:MAG: hypothetical protein AAFR23_05445 [Pseudomonadota bacterium]